MNRLMIVFGAGVVAGGMLVALVHSRPPADGSIDVRSLEQKLHQSEALVAELVAEIELLEADQVLFDAYESRSLASEQAKDRSTPYNARVGGPGSPGRNTTDLDRARQAADQSYRERLNARASDVYRKLAKAPGQAAARNYLEQARDIYIQAGSPNQAISMQEELLRNYPEPDPYHQIVELAHLQKTVGELDEAIALLDDAVLISPAVTNRLNGLRRAARYKELHFGLEAGLAAWRELEQYANAVGEGNSSPAKKAGKKIDQLERSLGLRQ